MDFSAVLKPIPIGRAVDQAGPKPLLRPAGRRRREIQLAEARKVVRHLPREGERLHGKIVGRFCLCDMLVAIVEAMGPARSMSLATLSYSRANVEVMQSWIANKQVAGIDLLCSLFFRGHNRGLVSDTLAMFQAAGPTYRLAARRTHVKAYAMDFENGRKLVIESSGNLRGCSSAEQFTVFGDPVLADDHAAWISREIELGTASE